MTTSSYTVWNFFFYKLPVQCFAQFSIVGDVLFLLLIHRRSLYILDIKSLVGLDIANILSQSVDCLTSVHGVFHQAQILNFDVIKLIMSSPCGLVSKFHLISHSKPLDHKNIILQFLLWTFQFYLSHLCPLSSPFLYVVWGTDLVLFFTMSWASFFNTSN